jgi:excisionase family DNA binding protein
MAKIKITIREAGAILGLSDNTVRDYCKAGKLPATKLLNNTWLIEKSAVDKMYTAFVKAQKQTA